MHAHKGEEAGMMCEQSRNMAAPMTHCAAAGSIGTHGRPDRVHSPASLSYSLPKLCATTLSFTREQGVLANCPCRAVHHPIDCRPICAAPWLPCTKSDWCAGETRGLFSRPRKTNIPEAVAFIALHGLVQGQSQGGKCPHWQRRITIKLCTSDNAACCSLLKDWPDRHDHRCGPDTGGTHPVTNLTPPTCSSIQALPPAGQV